MMTAAAGVSEGTIFKVFTDKDELIAAAVASALDPTHVQDAIAAIDGALPFDEKLRQAAALIQQRVVDIWRLLSRVGPRHHPSPSGPLPDAPALRALLAAHPDRLRVDPGQAAELLRGLTLALSHPHLVAEPKPPAEIVDLFLHGAAGSA